MNKKELVLGMLFLTTVVTNVGAQTDTLKVHSLEEVRVTTTNSRVASDALRIVNTLTAEDIASLPVQTMNELLDYLPGIDVRTRGVNGAQADISMRGGTFDQVLILINGVNVTDPQTGHANLDIPIDLNMVDRIEILQGTSMGLFGLSAFSGAINIITGDTPKRQLKASVAGGSFGFFAPSIGINYAKKGWRFTGSGSYNESSGYIENTDYSYGNLFLQGGYSDSIVGNWELQVGGQIKEFGSNSFYSLKFPDQFEATKTLLTSLKWDRRFGVFGIEASSFYRTHSDRFELFREGKQLTTPLWYKGHNYHITDVFGGNIKGAWYSSIGKMSVGLEARNEHILSNVLGDKLETPRKVPFTSNGALFTFAKNRLNLNYFIEQSFFVRHFSASIGFSGNYNTMFRNNFAFGANLGYAFSKGGHLFANVNRALRLPTFTDLYYKSATQTANPNLKPEESLTAELGIRWEGYGFRTGLSTYYRMGQNIIDWVKLPEEAKWRSVNHTRVDAAGGEVFFGYRYGYWLKNLEVNYAFCHLNKNAGKLLSKYALDYLRHKFTISLEHGIFKGFGAAWQLGYQNRKGAYSDRTGATVNYQPYWLFDGRIYWENQSIKVFLEGSNLTGKHYYDYGGILQPGRWLKAGILVKLNLK